MFFYEEKTRRISAFTYFKRSEIRNGLQNAEKKYPLTVYHHERTNDFGNDYAFLCVTFLRYFPEFRIFLLEEERGNCLRYDSRLFLVDNAVVSIRTKNGYDKIVM